MADVHGTTHGKKAWRNKPLFRREGDKKFRTGTEAADMLYEEAHRRDPYQTEYVKAHIVWRNLAGPDARVHAAYRRFLTAVKSFTESVVPVFDRYPKYAWVMKQLMEPERVIQFRVPWVDDLGSRRVNRGFRVQFSSCCGPYVGGLRFHPETRHGTVKFLAFENVFRNAVYGPLGGAAGGADFNPLDKSEAEIMRFCQSFTTELANYIGPTTDIPTAGVNVGPRELGFMFGQFKRLRQLHPLGVDGVLGGSAYFPQVPGHGLAHMAKLMVEANGQSLVGKRCLISGSGTVALNAADKLLDLGAIPIGFSDVWGHVIEPAGFTREQLYRLKQIKAEHKAHLGGYIMTSTSATYCPTEDGSLWDVPCDYAFPCAMQHDLDGTSVMLGRLHVHVEEKAKKLIKNGCKGLFEGAHLPLSQECMQDVFSAISTTAVEFNLARGDYHAATNITGFLKVAQAMFRQGAV
ncbi:hypothetical protein DYB37_000845 [Aphanomyces astaci]|uniref:Glutamate/phenylalanine/leucine/valine/L-tryptophan dehydrogenase C-terminal domain-containing protein n=1 Tax=Aphanomyces astaci TaxID=112090 RepID=A0A3R7F137_APHAT|nr:hypothetical protein DYB35_000496 [Aphanomyces astaci]RHZ21195.1 hypothetical protein DYB37_000845 [Aphanomyces astaci]